MASSDNQALKVSLVILGVITLGVLVVFIMQMEKLDEANKLKELAVADQKKAEDDAKKTLEKYTQLRELLVGTSKNTDDHPATLVEVEKILKEPKVNKARIDKLRGSFPTLVDAIRFLSGELGSSDKEKEALEKKNKDLENTLAKAGEEKAKEIEQLNLQMKQCAEDLKKEKATFADLIAQKDQAIQQYTFKYQNVLTELQQKEREFNRANEQFKTEVAQLRRSNHELKLQSEQLMTVVFGSKEAGRIIQISGGGTRAVVDIGQQDGLRNGQVFGIYGRDTGGNPYELPKANLEIVQILSAHQSVGRITGYKATSPVLDGDLIYSAVWSPGMLEGIAFAGMIYMDDDPEEDVDDFKKFIKANGGKVDSYIDPKSGKIVGELTHNTRWLVLGVSQETAPGAPVEDVDIKRMREFSKSMQVLRERAHNSGVPVISMRNFLTYMGYNSPSRSITAGNEMRQFDNRRKTFKGTYDTIKTSERKSTSSAGGN